MLNFQLAKELCTKCGLCTADCTAGVINEDSQGFPFISNEEHCIKCQHCLAICPTAAISIFDLDPAESMSLNQNSFPDYAKMAALVKGRRSVRQYEDVNVDPHLLNQILSTLSHAPTGVNSMGVHLHVMDDKDTMVKFRERVMDLFYDAVAKGGYNDPKVQSFAKLSRENLSRRLFRGAPHFIIASEDSKNPCPREDVILTLAYFELLAQSAGLGTVWWGYFAFVANMLPEVRKMVGVPDDHVFYAMLFGIPSINYPRAVQREHLSQIHRIG